MAAPQNKKPSLGTVVLLGFAAVMFWRGAWGLMDLYLFPNDPALSFLICIVLSIAIALIAARDHIEDII